MLVSRLILLSYIQDTYKRRERTSLRTVGSNPRYTADQLLHAGLHFPNTDMQILITISSHAATGIGKYRCLSGVDLV